MGGSLLPWLEGGGSGTDKQNQHLFICASSSADPPGYVFHDRVPWKPPNIHNIHPCLLEHRHLGMLRARRTFLDLPIRVRRRVYEDAGLIVGSKITLQPGVTRDKEYVFHNIDPYINRDKGHARGCWASTEQFQITYNLLQTCRQISEEVKSIICSENSLVVSMEHLEIGLAFLRRLSVYDCHNLKDLYVHLYVDDRDFFREMHNITLPEPVPLNHNKIALWQDTAVYIFSNLQPQKLTLHLICDIGIGQEIVQVLQPLHDAAGFLKGCGLLRNCELRLYPRKRHHISRLAEATAALVTGTDVESSPILTSDYLSLPMEVRLNILRYTNLVTPHGQLQWTSGRGFSVEMKKSEWCMPKDSNLTGSFCCRLHSGYSSRCRCWTPPKALMLACRTMYKDALHILYSHNRIIITPSTGFKTPICSCAFGSCVAPLRLDVSRFITRHVFSESMYSLRNIEFALPPFSPGSRLKPSSPFYLDWRFAIDQLKKHANLNVLTLRVYITFPFEKSGVPTSNTLYQRVRDYGGDSEVLKVYYYDLLPPLQTLRAMRRFFVFLEWPWHWTPDLTLPLWLQPVPYFPILSRMEACLEKLVMGDEYDSSVLGKLEEQPPVWLQKQWEYTHAFRVDRRWRPGIPYAAFQIFGQYA